MENRLRKVKFPSTLALRLFIYLKHTECEFPSQLLVQLESVVWFKKNRPSKLYKVVWGQISAWDFSSMKMQQRVMPYIHAQYYIFCLNTVVIKEKALLNPHKYIDITTLWLQWPNLWHSNHYYL